MTHPKVLKALRELEQAVNSVEIRLNRLEERLSTPTVSKDTLDPFFKKNQEALSELRSGEEKH